MSEKEQPGARYWALIEPWWLRLNATWDENSESFLAEFRSAPERVKNLYAGHWCQSEVCNGGLHQLFGNTTGILAPEAHAAFRAMRIYAWADVLADAMLMFEAPYPRQRSARRDRLPPRSAFSQLNDRFYQWLEGDSNRWNRVADAYAT